MIDVDFIRDKQKIFSAISFAGYVGILTGISNNLAIALNQRTKDESLSTGTINRHSILNTLSAIKNKATMAPWQIRKALENENDFEEYKQILLSTQTFTAPFYLIVAGTKPNEGLVYRRSIQLLPKEEKNLQLLNDKQGIFVLYQTNDDECITCGRCRFIREEIPNKLQKINPQHILESLGKPPVLVSKPDFKTFFSTIMNPKKKVFQTRFYE